MPLSSLGDRFRGCLGREQVTPRRLLGQRLSRIVIDGRRRALASGATAGPRQHPPFAYVAICEALRDIFSFGLATVPQEGLDGREGRGWET
jgi:hypothetical protein